MLLATSDSFRDVSGIRPQHDKLCALIGSRLNHPQGKFSQDDNVACMRGKLVCHVFGLVKPEESLQESLVALFSTFIANLDHLLGWMSIIKSLKD